MLTLDDICLRPARRNEKDLLWQYIYIHNEWKAHDAPYIPLEYQSRFQFGRRLFRRLKDGETAMVVDYHGEAIGYLSCYWEDQSTRWLEVGITLFTSQHWGKQLGRKALTLWISYLFEHHDVARIGLTTWSGNPRMMKCAKALGMSEEGRMRKVRFYQGEYYDSLRYGVLREEWDALHAEQLSLKKAG
ncbi:GNAT family N-acetyltransferase [Enterovibrio norvegicus]|uniref:GNAT family N-acetyltransferase n=1 Tax=Enterovibrio norvegicus TaxID=188144 RepID=UPI000C84EDA7|nr:GNAT family protein [Enterovibrio norvegicus]MCC4798419.1 GNAT family N-acetyltransferase [Enterovibrio norvegicus]PMI33240.1 GNAT family N-acetyltransferase [Enterovibrio norvegicus]PMN48209.1 GNAT family N-acetyltransferase [Enterovibrio norvegicus]